MAVVSKSYLLEAGVHFGHQTKRWNPKMKEYIFTSRDDIYADEKGNIYERTEGSWVKGHGHNNINDSRPPREPNDPQSYGRKWYNRWLKYMDRIQLSEDEIQLLEKYLEIEKTNKLSKKI